MMRRSLLSLMVLFVAFVPLPARAYNQQVALTGCNDTTVPIWVAVGDAGGASAGWWKIDGGSCRYVGSYWTNDIGFDIHAYAADGTNWSGTTDADDYYCVDTTNAFSLADGLRKGLDDPKGCPEGYGMKHFRYIAVPGGYDPNGTFSYTYHFHM